jgi:hypothetical protein
LFKYETESDREFRQILEVQNALHQSIRQLDSKVSEILGRTETIGAVLSSNQRSFNQQQQQQQPPQNQQQITVIFRNFTDIQYASF